MKEICLTQGAVTLVDDEDFALLNEFSWHLRRSGKTHAPYATRAERLGDEWVSVFMHRAILGAPPDAVVDHVNGNGLDNRRANLRLATQSQNCANKKRPDFGRPNRFKYRGINRQWNGSFQAQLCAGGKRINGGTFKTEEEAARAYDAIALQHFGPFARLNFPPAAEAGVAKK